MYDADFLRAQYLMSLIVEDFDMSEDYMRVNQVLLDEDTSPIQLINNLDNKDKDTKTESDQTVEDVLDLLDIDKVADRLEDMDLDNKINLSIEDPSRFNVNISSNDEKDDIDDIDNLANSIDVTLKDKVDDGSTINLTLKNSALDDLKVNINDPDNSSNKDDADIDLTLTKEPMDDASTLKVDVTDVDSDNKDNEIKLTLKSAKDLTSKEDAGVVNVKLSDDPKDADGQIHVKLMNTENEADDKVTSIINKRDELLKQDDPNLQLSTCLKIIVSLKQQLERLVNYIPDEVILGRTRYLIGDILDNLIDNSTILLKDKNRLKKVIYKIFDIVISVNKYIEDKFVQMSNKIDSHNKDHEDQLIAKQITDVETTKRQEEFKKQHNIVTAEDRAKQMLGDNIGNNNRGISPNNSNQNNQVTPDTVNTSNNVYNNVSNSSTTVSTNKRPNINKRRI